MTKDEKKALVKQVYPSLDGIALDIAIARVEDGDTPATYKQRVPEAPTVLRNEVVFTPGNAGKAAAKGFQVLKGAFEALTKRGVEKTVASKVAQISDEMYQAAEKGDATAKAVIESIQSGDMAAAEAAAAGSKSKAVLNWMKNHKVITGVGAAGTYTGIANVVSNNGSSKPPKAKPAGALDVVDLTPAGKTATASLDAVYSAGGDVSGAITTMQATGAKLSASDIKILQDRYQITVNTEASSSKIGVWTGAAVPEVKGTTKVPLKAGLAFPTITPGSSGFQDFIKYKQSFPIGDPAALKAFGDKVTAAGYRINGSNPVKELRDIWDSLGQISIDASRQGKQMTPDQALALQAGFINNGNTGPTVNETYSPTAKEDVKKLLNAQLSKLTGRTASDDDLEAFYNKVHGLEMKKGTKTTTTTVGKKSKTVVTPGYGQTEILAEAERVAQQDPMYKQLQSSNVFGDALSQALGVK